MLDLYPAIGLPGQGGEVCRMGRPKGESGPEPNLHFAFIILHFPLGLTSPVAECDPLVTLSWTF